MAAPLVELFTENDPVLLEEDVYADLEAEFEGWEPAEAGLVAFLTRAFMRVNSTTLGVASLLTRESLKTLGESIVGVPPILAASAAVTSTWTASDDAGYTIPNGTLVTIPAAGDEPVAFRVVGTVTIAPESTATAEGEVLLEAIIPGGEGNGLAATPELTTALAGFAPGAIVLTGPTSGGVDAEDEDAYLTRLVEELQTLTRSAVKPRDYAIIARRIAGVGRAVTIDNYDAEKEEGEVPLVVTVAVADAEGLQLVEGVKAEVLAELEDRSLTNVKVFVIDPDYTPVDAAVEIVVAPGQDEEAVKAAVAARLTEYLSPANHGLPTEGDSGSSAGWENQTSIYLNEVISEADRVAGVSRVVWAKLALAEGELNAEDVALSGVAPLPEAGTITVTT